MSIRSPNKGFFTRFANVVSTLAGHPLTFLLAIGTVIIWAVTGPVFGFNDTWQLVINTGTTIITFLMVFLIQNSQNRDSRSMQIKLDELIRANENAHKILLDLEELDDSELQKIQNSYEKIAAKARENRENGQETSNCPPVKLG